MNTQNTVNAFTIARRAAGFHVTIEAVKADGVTTRHTDSVEAAIKVAFDLIDPTFSKRLAVGRLIDQHFAAKPCELVDVEFHAVDETADVNFLYGGACTDAYTVNPNGTVTDHAEGGAL